MFRFSLLFCVTLIFGITAKPNKPWDKPVHEVLQDTVMSKGLKGKMSLGVEVEPPEDMQGIDYDFDPKMKIWSMMGQEKQPPKAQEVPAGVNDPSVSNLLKMQIQNLGTLPLTDIQVEPSLEDAKKYNQEPEEDTDDIDHPVVSAIEEPEQDMGEVYHKALRRYLAPLMADKADADVRVPPSRPKKDEDEPYHRRGQPPSAQVSLGLMFRGGNTVRVHLQPEVDMDDLYHKDVPLPIPDQGDTAPVEVPSQRRHSEPEEDLDDVYHQ